jgi:putative ABC transport system ATP-binding protein
MIEIKELWKRYFLGKSNEQAALKGISVKIRKGEMVAFMGPSGSGKSTLLHIIGLLDEGDGGEYFLDGVRTAGLPDAEKARIRNQRIGFVIQNFALIDEETVQNNVKLPLLFKRTGRRKEKVQKVLEQVGMKEYQKKKVKYLSGGQKQRVAIARALVNEPEIILADEPTGSLDSVAGKEIICIFQKLREKGKTIVIVTHDNEVASMCDRTIMISDGQVQKEKEREG